MNQNIRQQIEKQGFAFMEKYAPVLSTLEVSEKLGEIAHLPNVPLFQRLTPKQVHDSDPNTYSGNFGFGSFPLHSDLAHWHEPPRYLVLRCVTGNTEVFTSIVDSRCVISEIGELSLLRTLVIPRRPASNSNYLLRLLAKDNNWHDVFRWDEIFIKPANQANQAVFDNVSRLLRSIDRQIFYLKFLGDTLVVDNWRMLHGRSSVPNNSISRHIERVYLKEIN